MRVSIWSAFSSNHSSRFTVVGIFQSPEQAQQAAEDVTSQLRSIVDWYNRPENADARDEWMNDDEPSPPEMAIAAALNIPWSPTTLDWLWFDDQRHGPIKVIGNLVFIDGTESNLGAHPADSLIQRAGGQTLVDGYKDADGIEIASVVLDLSCTAPDQATADAIERATSAYLSNTEDNRGPIFQTPWESFGEPTAYSSFRGSVRQNGQELRFVGGFFHIADGFPGMLAYLRARGCSDIQYEFVEKNLFEED